MSERIERFEVEGTPTIQARVSSGALRVTEGPAGEITVRLSGKGSALDRYTVEQTGDLIEIGPEPGKRGGLAAITITVEAGVAPEVRARFGSGDFVASAPLADLQVDSASGDVRADRVSGGAVIRTASGDVRIGSIDGYFKVASASGDIQVGVAKGGADVKSASGDLRIKIADGGIKAKSASGDVSIGNLRSGDLDAKSLSGDVVVGIPAGRTLEVSLDAVSGKVSTEFPLREEGGDEPSDGGISMITVKTVSGDVVLRPAD